MAKRKKAKAWTATKKRGRRKKKASKAYRRRRKAATRRKKEKMPLDLIKTRYAKLGRIIKARS